MVEVIPINFHSIFETYRENHHVNTLQEAQKWSRDTDILFI